MTEQFKGFPKDAFEFLRDLAANNERAWFEANRDRYQTSLVAPMRLLIADMAPRLAKISAQYVADPRRSMFRIHRDVRFSKDKRPYKTHAAAQFRHAAGRDVHAPGFYVHIEPGQVFIGGGMWMPDAGALKAVREAIAADPGRWRRAVGDKAFRGAYGGLSDGHGGSLKRAPKGFDPDHPAIDDIKRTSFVFGRPVSDASTLRAKFLDEVAAGFAAAKPVMGFLCRAQELPF